MLFSFAGTHCPVLPPWFLFFHSLFDFHLVWMVITIITTERCFSCVYSRIYEYEWERVYFTFGRCKQRNRNQLRCQIIECGKTVFPHINFYIDWVHEWVCACAFVCTVSPFSLHTFTFIPQTRTYHFKSLNHNENLTTHTHPHCGK